MTTHTDSTDQGWTVVWEDENGSEHRETFPEHSYQRAHDRSESLRYAGYSVTIEDEG